MSNNCGHQDVDKYIAQHSKDIQEILTKIRKTIRASAPEAAEKISYQMPTFFFNGNLVHFAAFKNHIGFYPGPEGIEAFEDQLTPYKHAKGSVRFPLTQEIPYELIRQIVVYRYHQNMKKQKR